MIVYAIEVISFQVRCSRDHEERIIAGMYRTLEGAQKAKAELPLDRSQYADIVEYEVQD